MLRNPANKEEYNSDQYLKNVNERFSFDASTGIYKPKFYYKKPKRDGVKNSFKIAMLILNALTLYFLIRYTHYARLQWVEMKRTADQSVIAANGAKDSAIEAKHANETTKIALVDVQRAFVFLGPVVATVIGNNQVDFYFPMENSGTTPTRDMHMHISYKWMQDPLPSNFDFPDLWTGDMPKVNRHAMIGPKGSVGEHVGPLPAALVQSAIHHQIHLYFWGWTKYRDVFPDTPLHVTKFCDELVPLGQGEEITASTTTLRYSLEMCEHHNCYDEECEKK